MRLPCLVFPLLTALMLLPAGCSESAPAPDQGSGTTPAVGETQGGPATPDLATGDLSAANIAATLATLEGGTPEARRAAIETLAQRGAQAAPAVLDAVRQGSARVRAQAIDVFAEMGAAAVPTLRQGLGDSDDFVRLVCVTAAMRIDDAAAPLLPLLIRLRDSDPESRVRVVATQAVKFITDDTSDLDRLRNADPSANGR